MFSHIFVGPCDSHRFRDLMRILSDKAEPLLQMFRLFSSLHMVLLRHYLSYSFRYLLNDNAK